MKIYYYEYSDDRIDWWKGSLSWSVMNCIDMAQKQPYPWRIMEFEMSKISKPVKESEIQEALRDLAIFNTLFINKTN